MNIHELNEQRCRLRQRVSSMGAMNTLTDPDERLKQDAAYQLALDALVRAEREYEKALSSMSTDDLVGLVESRGPL